MFVSFIKPSYRDHIILAISQYQMLKPHMRLNDVAQCLDIVRHNHRSHFALRTALINYLDSMSTGFHLFGVKAWSIKTGHSLLRTLIMHALDAEQDTALLAYELAEEQRIKNLAPGVSREVLVEQNADLAEKLAQIEQKIIGMEDSMNEAFMQCQIMSLETKRLEENLTEAIWRADKFSVENVELNYTLLALHEENKKLIMALERKDQSTRNNLLFEQFGLPVVTTAIP
jgi:hypothetical protein